MFTSCKNNTETSNSIITVSQDKENIKASFDAMTTNLTQLRDGTFYQAMIEFLNVKNGEALDADWADQLGNGLGDVIDGNNLTNNDRFNFSLLAGKYTWNSNSARWTKTSNSTFLALFPSSKTSTINNCELGITSYTDKQFVIDGETDYLPTAANAYLKKDNIQIASLGFSAGYNSQGFPTTVNAQLYLKPITASASLAYKTDAEYSFNYSVVNENNKDNALSLKSDVSFSNGITNYTSLNDVRINAIQLTLTQGKLTVSGTIDVKTLTELENSNVDITASDINKTMNLEVLYNSQSIGTLKVEDIGNNLALFVVYKDGTEENTSIYYDSFISNIKSAFESSIDASSVKSIIKNQVLKAKIQKIKNKVLFWKK